MCLKIDIISYGVDACEGPPSVVLDRSGVSIGRSDDNQVVLPDESKLISRYHAKISYENGRYYVTDSSKNGTLIGNRDLQLKGNTAELFHGDRVRIGDYELLVSIMEPPDHEPGVSAQGDRGEQESAKYNIDDFFAESKVVDVCEPDFIPGPIELKSPVTDDDTDSPSKVPATDTGQAATPSSQDACRKLFDLFLAGAQMEDTSFIKEEDIPDMMMNLGAVFREMVNGLWTVLQGRAEQKSEMRALMTGVLHIDNNPLKLSPRLEDALRSLFKREHPAFLKPADAVRKGFEDLMNHHMAIIAGIQPSLREALDRFDPERIAEKHQGGFAVRRKCMCWDEYCRSYDKLRNDVLDELFGKVFVKAYEEQIEKLRSKKIERAEGNERLKG